MDTEIIATYCICDDYIRTQNLQSWPNEKISIQEVMTLAIASMRFFAGNVENARQFFIERRYIKKEICKSSVIKRLHAIENELWHGLLRYIAMRKKVQDPCMKYIIDSFPVAACRNIRIQSCRIYQSEEFRGYNTSKREYFYGVKANVITTEEGIPVQVEMTPGKEHDCTAFQVMDIKLPRGSVLYADSAYTDYARQEELEHTQGVRTVSERKSNSTRPISLEDYVELKRVRRTIENTFAMVSKLLPRTIHAVTAAGFEMKVLCFIIATAIRLVSS